MRRLGIGRLDTSLPFAEHKPHSYNNARAQAASDASDFSQRIRPGPFCRKFVFLRVFVSVSH